MREPAGDGAAQPVPLGRISGLFGTRGWLRVHSYTRPPENIFSYAQWLIGRGTQWHEVRPSANSGNGRKLRVHLDGVDETDRARDLIGLEIAVPRSSLPALPPGQHYWCDLIGLEVRNQDDRRLGTVSEIRETGAHDVLVVDNGSRIFVPFVPGRIVKHVDLAGRLIQVDWILEYL